MSYETDRLREADRDAQPSDGPGDSLSNRPVGGDGVQPHHEAMRREQLGQALRRLDALDGLTDGQQRTVRRLSRRLVASLSPRAAVVEGDVGSPAGGDD